VTDLERAFEVLKAKALAYGTLWDYYDGEQPLKYSTERLRTAFDKINVRFVANWCAVIVNTVLDRLVLKRFVVSGDEEATTRLNLLWAVTGMKLDDDEAHRAALVCGESYVIGWNDPELGIEAYYNDPRMVHLFYDEEHPRRKEFGAKWWRSELDGKARLNLYYADRVVKFTTRKGVDVKAPIQDAKAFEPAGETRHELGIVPVFQLRREKRVGSELGSGVLTLQDAVNKLLADMMVAAEFGSFKQRYIISQAEIKGKLKNAPNEIWVLPAADGVGQDTEVGEFEATELGGYLGAMDRLATAMAIVTRTPKHYLFEKAGSNPSGEALIALEAPLNAKAARYIERFQAGWREVAAFLLLMDGRAVDPMAIQAIYADPRTLQPLTQAQARQTDVSAGIPLRTVLRWEGRSEEDIAQMETERAEELAAAQESLATALVEQQRRFDRGGEG